MKWVSWLFAIVAVCAVAVPAMAGDSVTVTQPPLEVQVQADTTAPRVFAPTQVQAVADPVSVSPVAVQYATTAPVYAYPQRLRGHVRSREVYAYDSVGYAPALAYAPALSYAPALAYAAPALAYAPAVSYVEAPVVVAAAPVYSSVAYAPVAVGCSSCASGRVRSRTTVRSHARYSSY